MWREMTPLRKLLLLHILTRKQKKPEEAPDENADFLGNNRGNCENVDREEEKGP